MDESWVSHFLPESKQQSKEWSPIGAKPPRKAKRVESKKKLMYVLFFDAYGPIYQVRGPREIELDHYFKIVMMSHLPALRP